MDNTVKFRGGGFNPKTIFWLGPFVLMAILIVWEVGTRTGFISQLTLPRPGDVASAFAELWRTGALVDHMLPSLTRFIVGSTMGCLTGMLVGLMIGLFTFARAGLVPVVAAIFPIPKIALLPLFIIWFGIGEGSKYAIIALGTFTPMVVATYGAVDNVDRTLIRMGQSFSLKWTSIVRKIVIPGAMPGIFSGLRVSLAIGIILLVAAEMLGARHGIGAYILQAGSLYDLERLFAGVIILSMLGVLVNFLLGQVEKHVLRWRP